MAAFLRTAVADGMPFLRSFKEFESLRTLYFGQAGVIAELSKAEQRLRPKGVPRSANVRKKLMALRRYEKAIGCLLQQALAMYED